MFDFVQWDSPLALLIEVALSIVVLVALMWVARRVNASSPPPSRSTERQPQDKDANTSATPHDAHSVEKQSNE